MKVSVLAITKNGVSIGQRLSGLFPEWSVLAPSKFADHGGTITWYSEPTSDMIVRLFRESDALVCLFSLGAVIRLIAPHLKGKKTDPAVVVIDDRAGFVISVLSGHIGGANRLTRDIAARLDAVPVITTAADVNKTISVDLVGRDFGWRIEDDSAVTRVSAHMVNEEPIGVFQDAGRRDWYESLPGNVTLFDDMQEMRESGSRAHLIITDRMMPDMQEAVVYRPPSLVVGVGLHRDTPEQKILDGIGQCMKEHSLSPMSVARLVSIKKPQDVQGLMDAGRSMGVPIEYVDRDDLAGVAAPNPSDTVRAFEGTASVSEAAAILSSGGALVVEKQKFPPDLTVAIARIPA